MKKIDFIHELNEQLDKLDEEIKKHEEYLKQSSPSLVSSYADELRLLKTQKEKHLETVYKIQDNKETIIDDIKLGITTAQNKLIHNWEQLCQSHKIKQLDYNSFLDTVKKCNENPNHYDVKVDIEQLYDDKKKLVAIRLIDIINTDTDKSKIYPASKENTAWRKEFEKDLQEGFFNKEN